MTGLSVWFTSVLLVMIALWAWMLGSIVKLVTADAVCMLVSLVSMLGS
jgi:hypothetical protein